MKDFIITDILYGRTFYSRSPGSVLSLSLYV